MAFEAGMPFLEPKAITTNLAHWLVAVWPRPGSLQSLTLFKKSRTKRA